MKTDEQSSVYLDNSFKPPDRSTSAPPVLSLHSESLFAFRASEHLQLFSDIRCEDNYYGFYGNQTQGGKGLPPPTLENQPFLIDRSYVDEDEHLNTLSQQQQIPSHQLQIQQLQQQIQQQQQQLQLQQQMHLQQQYLQQHAHTQQQMHSPHHGSHSQHLQQQQYPPHAQHMHSQHHSQSQLPQLSHAPQHQQHVQQLPQHPHLPQHLPLQHHPIQPQQHGHSQFSHLTPLQQQQFQQMQHQQPHVSYPQHRGSVPDTRHPLPRSTSNPSYSMRSLAEEPSQDDLSEPGDAIWAPLPRASTLRVGNVIDPDYMPEEPGHNNHKRGGGGGGHYAPQHPQPQHPQQRDPASYYQNDFDNVAYSTATKLLDEVAQGNIQSLWNDGGYEGRQPQPQQQPRQIAVPTPKNPANIISLLGNGYFPEDKPRRNRTNSAGRLLPVPTTSPPLIQPIGPGSASTSPALPICRYYAQGFCSRGERCNFIHDDQSQQALAQLQGDAPFVSVTKPKAKKSVSSPPPLSMPPKVPSPVNIRGNAHGNGLHHSSSANGIPNGISNGNGSNSLNNNGLNANERGNNNNPNSNQNISSIIKSFAGMNVMDDFRGRSPDRERESRDREDGDGNSPPIVRSNSTNGLDLAFDGGSTSPNGSKSDLTRQYTSIEQVIGHIYSLCKDQHGCRFLQKKLEDRDPNIVEIIFREVYDHMTELMIDPFGNYLCQKLLEHCNDEQRLEIIEKVAPDLVKISKNMHGTRAVQKMIEYLTTPEQITIAKKALSNHVVTLIQDLNGNHVIQRCLNRLSPQDNQFIYDSVSQAGHCVEVATHRHGCCVLQRCIDHASDSQKIQLINEIIANALVLVQDPYGNYVVQYVLDLPFPGLASRLARRFLGHIPILSTQKFSSNVVEKCLNVTDVQTRAAIIQELVEYDNLLYLLQDPYANYVIQTSLNVSEPVQHARLVEAIRPHLTSLRNTPYGKRIQNKILKESSRDYYG